MLKAGETFTGPMVKYILRLSGKTTFIKYK